MLFVYRFLGFLKNQLLTQRLQIFFESTNQLCMFSFSLFLFMETVSQVRCESLVLTREGTYLTVSSFFSVFFFKFVCLFVCFWGLAGFL
ncbi:hypothetical protein BDR26DRAFT_854537, partial [Obelidium mucronatum]